MTRKPYGTRFTTGCGHSWRWRHTVLTVGDISGATMDCPYITDSVTREQCSTYLIIPRGQFDGMDQGAVPPSVHAPLFHTYLHQQDRIWPADGAGTGFIEFETH